MDKQQVPAIGNLSLEPDFAAAMFAVAEDAPADECDAEEASFLDTMIFPI